MSTVEKSMEKTKFYNREDLKAKDVVRLIGIWEGEAGESFTDYCDFSRESDKNFLIFLAERYPVLYDYHCKVAGKDWIDYCIQYVVFHCEEYLTQWVPEGNYYLYNQLLDMSLYPLSNRKDSTTITIRICRREILQLLQNVITNNNLFHLKRKWNKLMIKEPSASES